MARIEVSPEKLQEQINLLDELLEINLYLNSTLDLDSLLKLILKQCKEVLKVQAVSILLLDKGTGELFFRSAIGGNSESITPYRLKPGEGIAGAAVKSRGPIVVDDAQGDPRFARRFDSFSGFITRSMIAVPLWAKDQLIGVMEMMNRETVAGEIENFSSDDLQKATILANMAAVAIDNAQLYCDLNASYEMVKKAEKSKGEFISIISHELRTPLVPIKGYAYLLRKQRGKLPDETQNEFLDEILRQGEHLNMLIEDLFLVNEVESARFNVEISSVSFVKMVQEALLIRKIDQKTHPVRIEIDPELGKEEDILLQVDPDKMTHLLVHLLDNAVKFSPGGGGIAFSLSSPGGQEVRISVADHGIGVPEAFREKIFDRFFQIDSSSTRRYGGTGVGLYICRKISEAHGGTISCEPETPQGTRIAVHLPFHSLVRKDTSVRS